MSPDDAPGLPANTWLFMRDLFEASKTAARLVAEGHDQYQANRWLQLAAKALVVDLGEIAARACRSCPGLDRQHPELSLRKIIGVRNLVAHGYNIVDHEELWIILATDIPPVAAAVAALLSQAPPEGE